jgi:hypothetical protein
MVVGRQEFDRCETLTFLVVSVFLCVGRFLLVNNYLLCLFRRLGLPQSETSNELAPRLIRNRPGPVGCENAWDRYATSQQRAGPEKGDCG